MWISPVPLMWVARVTCATLYVLGNWNATWCVLPCKGQQNSSKTLSSLCLCSSTSLAFSLLTSHYFLLLFFPGAVPVTIFFTIYFQVHFKSLFFFTVFLLINYFMVSRGWLKSPFTILVGLDLFYYLSLFSNIPSAIWSTLLPLSPRCQDRLHGEKTGGAFLALQRDLEIPPFVVCLVLKKVPRRRISQFDSDLNCSKGHPKYIAIHQSVVWWRLGFCALLRLRKMWKSSRHLLIVEQRLSTRRRTSQIPRSQKWIVLNQLEWLKCCFFP